MIIHVLNGFVYGGLLSPVAIGLVIVFGLRQVVNFAMQAKQGASSTAPRWPG